jgi:uncharacterized DUF497 family protein
VPTRWLPEFEWDPDNEEKLLGSHDVTVAEVEECFGNPHTRRRSGSSYLLLGKTDGDRMLLLVYQQKAGGVVRVYSGREMTANERAAFRRHAK